jgi:antitoxin component YwqK of YwqJK toxin-antitoxin module
MMPYTGLTPFVALIGCDCFGIEGNEMNRKGYKSPIPKTAREIVDKRYEDGAKEESSFFVARKKVGRRSWWDDGQLMSEWGLKDGKRHGNVLDFDPNGQLSFVEPYRNGRPHGKATQFASDGSVLIYYVLRDGVGLDLWCQDDGKLSEEHYWPANGELGYTRWWNWDNKSIHSEESWLNASGRVSRSEEAVSLTTKRHLFFVATRFRR